MHINSEIKLGPREKSAFFRWQCTSCTKNSNQAKSAKRWLNLKVKSPWDIFSTMHRWRDFMQIMTANPLRLHIKKKWLIPHSAPGFLERLDWLSVFHSHVWNNRSQRKMAEKFYILNLMIYPSAESRALILRLSVREVGCTSSQCLHR